METDKKGNIWKMINNHKFPHSKESRILHYSIKEKLLNIIVELDKNNMNN
jgi:hypothetical protein